MDVRGGGGGMQEVPSCVFSYTSSKGRVICNKIFFYAHDG